MKTLIKFALIALVAILGYNYFFGDEKEQEQAQKIVGKVADLGSDIKALVLNERERYNDGKYDQTVKRFGELINSVRDKVSNFELKILEERHKDLSNDVDRLRLNDVKTREHQIEKIEKEIEDLYRELETAVEKI